MSSLWVIRPIDALDMLCAQLTRDLFAIAKFLLESFPQFSWAFDKTWYEWDTKLQSGFCIST